MAREFFVVTYQLPDTATGWQGNDVVGHVLRAPDNADGGGLTIEYAYAINAAATTSGTAHSLQLENWSTGGTAIKAGASGTIAAAIGGTADVFAASTPKAFTVDYPFVDAGEWVVLRKTETNSSDPTRGSVVIGYRMGK